MKETENAGFRRKQDFEGKYMQKRERIYRREQAGKQSRRQNAQRSQLF